jgi:hypothetical protein
MEWGRQHKANLSSNKKNTAISGGFFFSKLEAIYALLR